MNKIKKYAFCVIYALSGMISLGIEIIWIRKIENYVGGSVIAATLVMSSFFACAAIGNAIAIFLLPKIRKPLQGYAIGEFCFILFALLTIPLLEYLGPLLGGGDSIINWIILTCSVIFLPSLAQGICFPFISKAFVFSRQECSITGALFYALNLIGAASGVVIGGLLLPIYLGFQNSYFIFCGLGLLLAIIAWFLASEQPSKIVKRDLKKDFLSFKPFLIICFSGILSIACEIIIFAWFHQIMNSSLRATIAVLSAFILTLGAGSFLVMFLRKRISNIKIILTFFLIANSLILPLYAFAFIYYFDKGFLTDVDNLILRTFYLCLKSTLFLLPIGVCIGAIFPLSWELIKQEQNGKALALATFINKCGCAIGACIAVFLLLPFLGLSNALLVCGIGYALLLVCLYSIKKYLIQGFVLLFIIIVVGAFLPEAVQINKGHKLLKYYKGNNSIVSVTEKEGSRHIMVNQQYMLNGTAHSLPWQKQESWIPLFFTPNPKRVCFIGMASGIGANAVLDFPIEELDSVELIPQVKNAAEEYFSKWNKRLFNDKRSNIIIDDGRHFLQKNKNPYDTIICTLFLPSRAGSSNLYSKDFFQNALQSLSKNGTFCLWLPMYQMDKELASSIIFTFRSVFKNAIMVRGNLSPNQPILGLLASPNKLDLSNDFLKKRIEVFRKQNIDTKSPYFKNVSMSRLLLLGDLHSNPALFDGSQINSDDYPFVAFYGDKALRSKQKLRGLNLLKYLGTRFITTDYPSCKLGLTNGQLLLNGIRAGNHAYAASISTAFIPNASNKKIKQREQQAMNHLLTVLRLMPKSEFKYEYLHN